MKIYSCWSLGNMYQVSSELQTTPDHFVKRSDHNEAIEKLEIELATYQGGDHYKALVNENTKLKAELERWTLNQVTT